jgi:hypothetical protein
MLKDGLVGQEFAVSPDIGPSDLCHTVPDMLPYMEKRVLQEFAGRT